jgi:hypothetical protein
LIVNNLAVKIYESTGYGGTAVQTSSGSFAPERRARDDGVKRTTAKQTMATTEADSSAALRNDK